MDTIKIDSKEVKMIAHRGLSGIEKENPCPAFIAAANRSYYGIETDVHVTADGKFVVIHDDTTERVCLGKTNLNVEQSTYDELKNIVLPDLDESTHRQDIRIPLLKDYLKICKKYNKVCVLELKNDFAKSDIEKMIEEIPAPREEMSKYAPRAINMMIDPDKIRIVIGPGGKTINRIVDETGVKIDISEDDPGLISIYSSDMEGAEAAKKEIELLTKEVEVGETYEGKVTRIMNFGAFIEILPGKEGLLHISKMAKERVEKVEDVMNIGDVVKVKVTEIDSQNRINLSRKELL